MSRAFAVIFVISNVDERISQIDVEDAILEDAFDTLASVLSLPDDSLDLVEVNEVDNP